MLNGDALAQHPVDGMAHDMSTPLGVLLSNLAVLDEYATELIRVADAAGKALRLLETGGSAEEAQRVLKPVIDPDDLAYLLGDLPELITESSAAATRLADVVRRLGTVRLPVAKQVPAAS